MSDNDELRNEAMENLLTLIKEADATIAAQACTMWAEAYAWLKHPDQPHG